MAAMGFTPDDYDETVEVWPENWRAWCLYAEMSGQWRRASSGLGGSQPVALDYTPLFMRMERMALSDEEFNSLFADIRVIEAAALEEMRA